MRNKPHRYFFLLQFLLVFADFIQAQPPSVYWEHFYGGTKVDFSGRILSTRDNGYVVAGYGASVDGDFGGVNNGFNDFELVKVDSCGSTVWAKVTGGNHQDLLYALSETTEHGFLLSGMTFSTNLTNGYHGGVQDAMVCKVDANGNIQWIKTFGGSKSDILFNAVALPDSSCIIVGMTTSLDGDGSPDGKNGWILKLDKNGNVIWKQFPGNGVFYLYDIKQSGDGNFIISDYYGSILKIDGLGNLLWERNYGGRLLNIENTISGGFIASGTNFNTSGNQDGYVVRVDADGNLLWDKFIGGTALDHVDDMVVMPDNTYVFAGYSNSTDGDVPNNHGLSDCFAFALDDNGALLWKKSYGGSARDEFHGVSRGNDGSVVLSGFVGSSNGDVSGNHASWDFVMLKLRDIKTRTIDSVSCNPIFINSTLITHDTTFTVVLKDACNYDSAYINYQITIQPEFVHTINDVSINYLDQITLNTTASGPVLWTGTNLSCYNCLSPTVSPRNITNTYIVQTGSGNCAVADTVKINVKATDTLYVPTAFTPNGDGKNDFFNALGIVTDYSMEIFNRWGERVFKTNSLISGWDGTYKGTLQPAGTFVYFIRYKSSWQIPKSLKGNITLIR